MLWGCFLKLGGLGPLAVLNGSMDSVQYIDFLETFVVPEIEAAKDIFKVDFIFMQDNAPCHKARTVMDYYQENNISTLPWPP